MWLQGYVLNGVVQRTVLRLRADVEDKLHRLPLRYFDTKPRGELLSRVTNDIDNVQQSMQQTMSQLLNSLLTLVGVLAMMLWISPLLALVALVSVPLSIVVTRLIAKRSQPLFVQQWAQHRRGSTRTSRRPTPDTRSSRSSGTRRRPRRSSRTRNERALPGELRRAVPVRHHHAGDHVHREPQLRLHRRDRRPAGRVGRDVARRRAGVHPVLPPVQPAADPGRVDVQPAAVRRRVRRAGLRPARRRGAGARPGASPSDLADRARAGRVRARVVPLRRRTSR